MAAQLGGCVLPWGRRAFSGTQLQQPACHPPARTSSVTPVRMAQSVQGKVVSTKMQKSVVVEVDRYPPHPLYKKRIRRTKRYIAHDEEEATAVGDIVLLDPCRPLSRHKKYTVAKIIDKSAF